MGIRINYGDGNGNQYIIEQDSIEYNPIKPIFSSSGVYDGGEPVKKMLAPHEYNEIVSTFKNAIADEASHFKDRVKGSGVISIQEGNAASSCILSPNSEKLNEIEIMLKEMLKQ